MPLSVGCRLAVVVICLMLCVLKRVQVGGFACMGVWIFVG